MAGGQSCSVVTRSWISDTPDEVEHPPIPLGLNRMAVPRAAIVLSVVTGFALILSSIWVGLSAMSFLDEMDASFGSTDVEILKEEDRWVWEVGFLLDSCSSREDDWIWPEGSLSDQDDSFLLPGEIRCDWHHQGEGDSATVVVYNRGNQSLDLVVEISGGGIIFSSSEQPYQIINDLEPGASKFFQIDLIENIVEREISISATHVTVIQAKVRMDLNIIGGSEEKDVHIEEGDPFEVEYTVWDADTGVQLDDGNWGDTAGGEGFIECNFSIIGFCWSAIGLDIDNDRGLVGGIIDTGTTHTTLLPPDIAYGNNQDSELKDSWLRFELKLVRAPISG